MSETVTTIGRRDASIIPIGRSIVRALVPAENAIDVAIADSSTLLAAVVRGRVDSGLAAEVGHDAVRTMARCLTALVAARDEIVDGHRMLSFVRDAIGMTGSDFGCSATKFAVARVCEPSAEAA